jgi:hypothetical protein
VVTGRGSRWSPVCRSPEADARRRLSSVPSPTSSVGDPHAVRRGSPVSVSAVPTVPGHSAPDGRTRTRLVLSDSRNCCDAWRVATALGRMVRGLAADRFLRVRRPRQSRRDPCAVSACARNARGPPGTRSPHDSRTRPKRSFDGLRQRTVRPGRTRRNLTRSEKEGYAKTFAPTTLFDFLYRLRLAASYGEAERRPRIEGRRRRSPRCHVAGSHLRRNGGSARSTYCRLRGARSPR